MERPPEVDDLNPAADEERAVRPGLDRDRLGSRLLGAAVEPPVVERAGRARLDGAGDRAASAASTATQGRASGSKTCGRPRTQFLVWMHSRGSHCTSIESPA